MNIALVLTFVVGTLFTAVMTAASSAVGFIASVVVSIGVIVLLVFIFYRSSR